MLRFGLARGVLRAAVLALAPVAAMAFAWSAAAQNYPLPQYTQDQHLGVITCAGSTCHGALEPWQNSKVLQNEYITWQREDKHAKAYAVLLNDRSRRIARNLGLEAAHTAPLCLDCHADNPPANLRSARFQLSDGVGCEACHGGSVRYLGLHATGIASHEENVNLGLYPTELPVERAKLCLSCHFGMERKFVDHRIMGAGHPRMAFELDTFTAIQPAHYVVDKDYTDRKAVYSNVKVWAIGQAIAVSETMKAMADDKMGRDGAFPELVLFDCHACHHSMEDLRWAPRASIGLPPGVPRINDANMIMLAIVAREVDAKLGDDMMGMVKGLHNAAMEGQQALAEAAKKLKAAADQMVPALRNASFGKESLVSLMNAMVAEGLKGEFVAYAAAEQATMAMSSILQTMRVAGVVDADKTKEIDAALAEAYAALADDDAFKPDAYLAALRSVDAVVPKF